MAEGSAELELFRRRWREELAGGAKRRRREAAAEPAAGLESRRSAEPSEPGYLALARGLLDGGAPACRSPSPARPAEEPAGDGGGDGDDLLGQLIRDLVGLRGAGAALGWGGGPGASPRGGGRGRGAEGRGAGGSWGLWSSGLWSWGRGGAAPWGAESRARRRLPSGRG